MADKGEVLKGVFYDGPVEGLEYQTQTLSGITDAKGGFQYRRKETVTFSVGGLVLGSAAGGERVTPADIVIETGGDVKKIKNNRVTNIAAFLQSLDEDDNVENGITISNKTKEVVRGYRYKVNLDQSEEDFARDGNVKALFAALGKKLRTPAQARNHLRRTLMGIKKITDVKVPTRDGSYLLADIFLPIEEGQYPVVINQGAFGKSFGDGCICNDEDLITFEQREDDYFEGNPPKSMMGSGSVPWEKGEAANAADWVPRGYVLVRVDDRGVCKVPGGFEQFSLQEAKDYYDSIEWSAKQPWANGNVGIWGTGYYAMIAYNVAQLQPPSLKAMINVGGDVDSYRDYGFTGGGLWNEFNGVMKNSCGEWQGVDWVEIAHQNPFCEPEIYGPEGKICITPDLSKVTMPFWSAAGISGALHTRGSCEAYVNAAATQKKLTLISECGIHYWAYAPEHLESHVAFFDYWLKGIDNGIMDEPPVKMMVRTGYGGHYWQEENEWPVARTQYRKYYLNAAPSSWGGDGQRSDFLKLDKTAPGEENSKTYPAGMDWDPETAGSHGISFVTEPMPEDVLLAGYAKLVVWVSSTTYDMELHASVRVMDENDQEVLYPLGKFDMTTLRNWPAAFGALKVSHRKLDPVKSTEYRPYHTHLKKDHQPLNPGEPVEAEVEFWPTTAVVRKGWRIRLDIGPVCSAGIGMRLYDALDQGYQKGSSNTVHTGPGYPSYLQLPVVPPKP